MLNINSPDKPDNSFCHLPPGESTSFMDIAHVIFIFMITLITLITLILIGMTVCKRRTSYGVNPIYIYIYIHMIDINASLVVATRATGAIIL